MATIDLDPCKISNTKFFNELILNRTTKKEGFHRFPPPPPSLGPFGAAPFGTLPLLLFCTLAVTSAFLALFSSFDFLILSLISLHKTSCIEQTSISTSVTSDSTIEAHWKNQQRITYRSAASLAASRTSGFSVRFFCMTSKVAPTMDLE